MNHHQPDISILGILEFHMNQELVMFAWNIISIQINQIKHLGKFGTQS
jgi:hypothetical protein